MSFPDILATLNRLQEELTNLNYAVNRIPQTRVDFLKQQYITGYPNGGVFSSGVGRSTFDFYTGDILLYDGTKDSFSSSLKALEIEYLSRFFLWADSPVNVTYQLKKKVSPILTIDQFEFTDSVPIAFDKFTVNALLPANMVIYGSTSLEQSSAQLPTESQLRYSTGTAPSAFKAVTDVLNLPQFQAFAPNFQTGGKILSNSGITFTAPYIYSPNVVRKTFLIFNTDKTKTLNVNIKGNGGDLTDTNWVDDASSGASTAITAGNNAVFDISTRYHYLLVRLSGSASYVMYYLGTSA